MNIDKLRLVLLGHQILSVNKDDDVDEGYIIGLDDGTTVEFYWSSDEGDIMISELDNKETNS